MKKRRKYKSRHCATIFYKSPRNSPYSNSYPTNPHRKHGLSRTQIYSVWSSMRARCENTKHIAFKNYGGRGIKVCKRWLKFENFFADMGERPTIKHSLDRRNNDGNYEPGNCRWATAKEQYHNSRRKKREKRCATRVLLRKAVW